MNQNSALVANPPPLKQIIRAEACGKCKWAAIDPSNVNQRQCRRYPPSIQFIPMIDNAGRIKGTPSISGYPIVKEIEWCGEFKPRVEGLS